AALADALDRLQGALLLVRHQPEEGAARPQEDVQLLFDVHRHHPSMAMSNSLTTIGPELSTWISCRQRIAYRASRKRRACCSFSPMPIRRRRACTHCQSARLDWLTGA